MLTITMRGSLRYTAMPMRPYSPSGRPLPVSFVHVASFAREDGDIPLQELAAFRDFTENIGDRCDEPPRLVNVRQIGAYGLDWEEAGRAAR